eukprot:TRINITY_DN3444_c0_g2_i1.p1 TRINITY_DN3444_c0_g2~~TRINITY_DN3444_c0_g2_i1.p1  ORF type:complete len:757 (-),score=116.40 TRINITY_DN3444_c0_g2_i1:25-2295(-)
MAAELRIVLVVLLSMRALASHCSKQEVVEQGTCTVGKTSAGSATAGLELIQKVPPSVRAVKLDVAEEALHMHGNESLAQVFQLAGQVTVVSYNLYWWNVRQNNRWGDLHNRIREEKPFDLIGFQECDNVESIVRDSGLDGFDFWQGPSPNPCPLAWDRAVFTRISEPGTKWVASDQYGNRHVNFVRLRHVATGAAVFFANTHGPLGNCGNSVGQNWADAVTDNMQAGDIAFMTGDFNCGTGSTAMNKVHSVLTQRVEASEFGGIDQILTNGQILSGGSKNGWPSDHPLVQGTFALQSGNGGDGNVNPAPPAPPVPSTDDCAAFGVWPDVDGVTCAGCTALVMTAPHGGRCDRYCESFGHICIAAAEEQDENCQVQYQRGCNEPISGTSDMLCTCQADQGTTGSPSATVSATTTVTTSPTSAATTSTCYGELSAVAADEGAGVGEISTLSLEECKRACTDMEQCQSAAFCPHFEGCWLKDKVFTGVEGTRDFYDCKTIYKTSCDGTSQSLPAPSPPACLGDSCEVVTVMTYNTVYTGYPCCGSNKVPQFGAKIREVGPAVVGAQEVQVWDSGADLLAKEAGYQVVPGTGPQNPILYHPSKVSLVADTGGWMDVPRDNYAQRTLTWAKFRIGSGSDEFWFFNTHLPHNGDEAAPKETHARIARMLLAKREELGAANTATAVVCDCNPFASGGSSEGSFESNLASGGIVRAYMGTGAQGGYGGLDKIFYSPQFGASNGADHGTGSSDHPAITADLRLSR